MKPPNPEFLDITLQGIINSILGAGAIITAILMALKYRREVQQQLRDNIAKSEERVRQEADQRRKDEAERMRIETEAEAKKDALLLESYSQLASQVAEKEKFVQALLENESRMREECRKAVDAERRSKHDIASDFQAAQLSWEKEKAEIEIAHQKEIAAINAANLRAANLSSDCEKRIAELTKRIEQLTAEVRKDE